MAGSGGGGDQADWPLAQRPGFLVRRLYQIHVALFAAFCDGFGITPAQYSLLSALARRGAADQTTLAADVALDKTTAAGALKRLEARGLIRRDVSPDDRRARLCVLTPAAKALLVAIEPAAHRAHDETLAGLAPDERRQLVALLARAITAHPGLDGAVDAPLPPS